MATVVEVRSYSRISGTTSDEIETRMLGRGAQHGLPRPPLQLGVGEAVEEGDGDRLDPGVGQLARQALDVLLVQIVPGRVEPSARVRPGTPKRS